MCLLYATQTTLEINVSFLAFQSHQMGLIVLPQKRSSTVGTFATTISEVRNNTYYARPGQLSLEAFGALAKNTCNRLYHLVERYNLLLVNE